MKRNYIIPTTESLAFYAGSICDVSGGSNELTIEGPLGGGGEAITPIDPM